MVVEVVACHTEVEAIDEPDRIVVLFKLVRRDDNIVAANQIQPRLFVISHQRIAYPRVLVAVVQPNTVAAVIANGNTINEDFVYPPCLDAVAAFFVAGDAEVS